MSVVLASMEAAWPLAVEYINDSFAVFFDAILFLQLRFSRLSLCRGNCGDGSSFQITAQCGSIVSLYITDDKYYPNNGTAPLDVGGNACASSFPSNKL